jgi:hypothetical protein
MSFCLSVCLNSSQAARVRCQCHGSRGPDSESPADSQCQDSFRRASSGGPGPGTGILMTVTTRWRTVTDPVWQLGSRAKFEMKSLVTYRRRPVVRIAARCTVVIVTVTVTVARASGFNASFSTPVVLAVFKAPER